MARYIDLDKAIESIRSGDGTPTQKLFAECCLYCVPTADVVPKSEVARKICCEIEEEIVAALESNYKAKADRLASCECYFADEIVSLCEGKIAALRGIEGFVEELKKKYTEENDG